MSSGTNLPVADQAGAAVATTEAVPGTFLGLGLDLKSDKLYDLGGANPDVMGLRAIQPKAAVVKVMSVPDSCCVRVVVPDDHLQGRIQDFFPGGVRWGGPVGHSATKTRQASQGQVRRGGGLGPPPRKFGI